MTSMTKAFNRQPRATDRIDAVPMQATMVSSYFGRIALRLGTGTPARPLGLIATLQPVSMGKAFDARLRLAFTCVPRGRRNEKD